MNILVENSGYRLQNMGDLAMLQVGVSRLKSLFPNASITVFTTDPTRLRNYCPETNKLIPEGRDQWTRPLVHKLYDVAGESSIKNLIHLEDQLTYKLPGLRKLLLRLKLWNSITQFQAVENYLKIIQAADLVVATGGGYISDAFLGFKAPKLDTLAFAAKAGKPTAILGQGIGPLKNQATCDKVKMILPLLDLISLREKRASLPLLADMGISKEKIIVTGDDAIELAYNARPSSLGGSAL